jgi:hypothetical protein
VAQPLCERLLTELLSGSMPAVPLTVHALLCDLRPRFLAKGQIGRGFGPICFLDVGGGMSLQFHTLATSP